MAKAYKVTLYLTDANEHYDFVEDEDKEYLQASIEAALDRLDTFNKVVEIKQSDEFEWDDGLKINMIDATNEDYEKYFKSDYGYRVNPLEGKVTGSKDSMDFTGSDTQQFEDQDYLKFLLKKSNLMYEIVTGETSQAQEKLLQLYENHPHFLARSNEQEESE